MPKRKLEIVYRPCPARWDQGDSRQTKGPPSMAETESP